MSVSAELGWLLAVRADIIQTLGYVFTAFSHIKEHELSFSVCIGRNNSGGEREVLGGEWCSQMLQPPKLFIRGRCYSQEGYIPMFSVVQTAV